MLARRAASMLAGCGASAPVVTSVRFVNAPPARVSSTPAYLPIYLADRYDKFWASKILMRFTREHSRAAVTPAWRACAG